MSPPPAAVPPPSLKRARRDSESSPSQSPVTCTAAATASDQMEAPLAVALSQSMDSVNTATGEEEVSFCFVCFVLFLSVSCALCHDLPAAAYRSVSLATPAT